MSKSRTNSSRSSRSVSSGTRSPLVPGRTPLQSESYLFKLRAKWAGWAKSRGPIWWFGLKFVALMAMYYVLVLTPVCDQAFYVYLRANAWLANVILNWLGQDSHVSEITISSTRFAITVRRGCDAIEPSWFFCAALISYPAPWRRKALGILAGALLLQALNLVRIVSLYFIGFHYPAFFGPAHVEIWPVVFVVVAVLLWVGWIGWTRPRNRSAQHAAA